MFHVVDTEPSERLTGLDAEGLLKVENAYACPHCEHRLSFPLFKLGERAERWARSGPEEPDLDEFDTPLFEGKITRWLQGGRHRFSVEWNCPGCQAPAAMVVERRAGKFGVERFFPLVLLERFRRG